MITDPEDRIRNLPFFKNFFSEIVKTINLISGNVSEEREISKNSQRERERKLSYWN